MAIFDKKDDAVITALEPSTVMLLGGDPVGPRHIWWNFVHSSKDRIDQAKAVWKAGRMDLPRGDDKEFIPLPENAPPPVLETPSSEPPPPPVVEEVAPKVRSRSPPSTPGPDPFVAGVHGMKPLLAALTAAASTLALCAAAHAAEPSDTQYTVLMGKGPSGAMEVKVDADGARHTTYQYTDRGRGPSTLSEARFDANGDEIALRVTGVDYLKAPVDERFAVDGGQLTWTSRVDGGSVLAAAGRVYLPFNANSEDLAILARRLLAAPNHELDLAPNGHARIEETSTREVLYFGPPPPSACSGACVGEATLYLIEGLAFEPVPIWLSGRGASTDHALVFEGSSWISTVPKGQEAVASKLIALQSKVLADRSADEAKTMQSRPGVPVAILHATLFDTVTRKLVPNTTVIVEGNKVTAVGPDARVAVPPTAMDIDAHGRVLMPGLTDMHVHLSGETDGKLDILNGVTTVRDMGNDLDELGKWEAEFDSGEQIGPRVWKACLVDGRGPFAGPTKMLISTPDEAHAAVQTCWDHGFRQMKIYSSVDPKLVPVIIADAHGRGMRVSGHIPASMTMEEGIADGYDEVQHANFWFLNFRPTDVVAKTNTIVRLKDPAEHAKDLDLDSPQVQRFIALLQAHHTVVDPTLVAFEDDMVGDPRQPSPELAADASRLPPQVARGATGDGLGGDAEQRKTYAASYQRFLDFTGRLYKAGIRIVGGTDGMTGFPLVHELEEYVAAGIPSDEVLQLATLGDAQVMHHDDLAGSIAPGKNADLILIDGNPVANISDLRKVTFVMKDGVIYDLPAIERSVGVKPLPDQTGN